MQAAFFCLDINTRFEYNHRSPIIEKMNQVIGVSMRIYQNGKGLVVLLVCLQSCIPAAPAEADQPPHSLYPVKLMNLETGYVLGNQQNVMIGLNDSGIGSFDRVQFSTNILMDLLTLVNGQVKVALLPDEGVFPALSAGIGYYNLVSSEYVVDFVLKEAFTDEDMSVSSGLDILTWFISASKKVNDRLRLHAGFQFRRLEGNLSTDEPVEMGSDGEPMGIEVYFNESATHRSILFGADLDLFDSLKFMLELGNDLSYGKPRGGTGFRLGVGRSFALQAGILWPGIKLDEDIDIPVLPHFSFFWRF
ncbi:MAG: hypothetical protein JW746_04220 [Candidatus Krumholzibacteriota bacterium]|nr:hypothetical protein [Candidatus Krumholzibacteriota bacterium]